MIIKGSLSQDIVFKNGPWGEISTRKQVGYVTMRIQLQDSSNRYTCLSCLAKIGSSLYKCSFIIYYLISILVDIGHDRFTFVSMLFNKDLGLLCIFLHQIYYKAFLTKPFSALHVFPPLLLFHFLFFLSSSFCLLVIIFHNFSNL